TDENELGFDYEAADLVLKEIVDNKKDTSEINIENIPQEIVEKVIKRIKNQAFKLEVPYRL
ncbi:MAG: NAD(+) synthetase, partial [Candidatus Pacebacteria bacterium]|nr:NAD(+) synthetase [Candidatus Paceibacterota bacterium]